MIDCTIPARDAVLDVADLERHLRESIKVVPTEFTSETPAMNEIIHPARGAVLDLADLERHLRESIKVAPTE